MRRLQVPSPYAVLMVVIALSAVATWLLPAGGYDQLRFDEASSSLVLATPGGEQVLAATPRVLDSLGVTIPLEKFTTGGIRRPVSVPGTYSRLAPRRQGLLSVLMAPIVGTYDAVDVVLFVLVIGGFIEVFSRSGAFAAGIARLVKKLEGREAWLIVILTSLFAVGGTTYGMAEETIAFYPLLVPIFVSAGYDLMVPLGVVFVGAGVGFLASTTNPFATIIASDAAGVSWTEGLAGRLLVLVVGTAVCIAYILRYGSRVRAGTLSSLADAAEQGGEVPALITAADTSAPDLTPRARLMLGVFGLTFVVMIVGVARGGWWFPEMTALFFASAVLVGLIEGGGEKRFAHTFVEGAERLLGVSLIIGMARGVTILLDQGRVSGTLLHASAGIVEGMPAAPFLVGLMLVYFVLTFFVSSSSGMAVLTMPILGPLAQVVGVSGSQIVNAYLFGFGLMSLVAPTGLILPSLAMVNVSYLAWLRFVTPLLLILALMCGVFLALGGVG